MTRLGKHTFGNWLAHLALLLLLHFLLASRSVALCSHFCESCTVSKRNALFGQSNNRHNLVGREGKGHPFVS